MANPCRAIREVTMKEKKKNTITLVRMDCLIVFLVYLALVGTDTVVVDQCETVNSIIFGGNFYLCR